MVLFALPAVAVAAVDEVLRPWHFMGSTALMEGVVLTRLVRLVSVVEDLRVSPVVQRKPLTLLLAAVVVLVLMGLVRQVKLAALAVKEQEVLLRVLP